jgi:putative endonuclease
MMARPQISKIDQIYPLGTSTISNCVKLGSMAESVACQFLIDQDMQLKCSNYRTRRGEIDLIMLDADCLVFIEVKYRRTNKFGSSEESITQTKCQKVISAAKEFLVTNGYKEDTYIRFDAVLISPTDNSQSDCTINWIQNILT